MNPDRYQQVMRILDQVLDCETGRREEVLSAACGGDAELRGEVERLLAQNSAAGPFLGESPFEIIPRLREEVPAVGRRLGPYRVVEEVGRGGMGAVYKAVRDDEQYETVVAVKLIKSGMDSEAILRRFVMERQILANLNHPNIARLLDGGTTEEGAPYFVMEYVEGRPIDRHCDELRLSTTERLKLFRTVCSAVSYAHQNLVVHRDLKPSNILVTADGTPKLLDFGIAKILHSNAGESSAALTATELRVMTPEYASPEQVRGGAVTTATDVYSLGVLLYELLTGHRPYRFQSHHPDEVARVISEVEPERPSTSVTRAEEMGGADPASKGSTSPESVSEVREGAPEKLRRRLRGDVDNIVLTALRKEPQRRYQSVEQFSEDIRRHLEGLPVLARKDTFTYRAQKFVRRHRAGVAAAALVSLALVAGLATTLWQARVARAERARAERRFNDVRRLANSFLFEFYDEIDNGPMKAKELLVRRALEYLDSLSQEAAGDVGLKRELAKAYEKIGRIQGNSYYANLGDTDGAMKSYQKSLEIRRQLASADPSNPEIQDELAYSYWGLGDMLYTVNDLKGGLASYEQALRIEEALAAAHPDKSEYRANVATILINIGDIKGFENYANLGDTVGSIESYKRSASLLQELLAGDPDNRLHRPNFANCLARLAVVQGAAGDTRGAVENGRKAVGLLESLIAAHPNDFGYKTNLLVARSHLRQALVDDGQRAAAIENTRGTIKMLEALAAAEPQNTLLRRGLAINYRYLGEDLLAEGDRTGAADALRRSLSTAEALLEAAPKNDELRELLAISLSRVAEAQATARDFPSAVATYRRAIAVQEEMLADAPSSPDSKLRDELSNSYAGLGRALAGAGDQSGALAAFRKAVPLAEEVSSKSPTNVRLRARLAQRYFDYARLLTQPPRPAMGGEVEGRGAGHEAQLFFERSLRIWDELRAANALSKPDAGKPDEVRRALAKYGAG